MAARYSPEEALLLQYAILLSRGEIDPVRDPGITSPTPTGIAPTLSRRLRKVGLGRDEDGKYRSSDSVARRIEAVAKSYSVPRTSVEQKHKPHLTVLDHWLDDPAAARREAAAAWRHLMKEAGEALPEGTVLGEEEEKRRLRSSWRLERKPGVRADVPRERSSVCEGCGLDPAARYRLPDGIQPARLLDVHHRFPLAAIEDGGSRVYEIPDDFAVLCGSCHALAHLQDDPSDIPRLRERVRPL